MKLTRRFWVWSVLVALLALLVLPDALESFSNHRQHQRIAREKEKVTALVAAGDRGYDELVQILPTLWFFNVPDALNGILAQKQRDRVADLCKTYVSCGNNHNTKEAICRALQKLGDLRAAPVLQKDLESVWTDLTLIEYDSQIETLGTLRAKDSADLLLRILQHQYSWEGSAWRVKEEVFVALGKMGDQRAMPDAEHYIEADGGGDWYLRQGALNYLIHTRIADLHIWQVAVNKFAAIISVVSHEPKAPQAYKDLLKEHEELVHVTVEVNLCVGDDNLVKMA